MSLVYRGVTVYTPSLDDDTLKTKPQCRHSNFPGVTEDVHIYTHISYTHTYLYTCIHTYIYIPHIHIYR